MKASDFWAAAQAYRSASTEEARHRARVALLGLALSDTAVGHHAAELLRGEGLIVVRPSFHLDTRAL